MNKTLKIDFWSDIVCPWCGIGKRRLGAALSRFPHRDDVEVLGRVFELERSAPDVRAKLVLLSMERALAFCDRRRTRDAPAPCPPAPTPPRPFEHRRAT